MTYTDTSVQEELSLDCGQGYIRHPGGQDAAEIHELIHRCKPLDENSLYCNLLQTTHFADTCALVECDGKIVAFVSGYRPPRLDHVLFIWQVAVDPDYRGKSLGKRLMKFLLSKPEMEDVRFLHTTITKSNGASKGLFDSLVKDLGCRHGMTPMFDRQLHFHDEHESEHLMHIGPFNLAELPPLNDKE